MSLQAPTSGSPKTPPLPPARLRIGVTGHRPGDKLSDSHVAAVTVKFSNILQAISSESKRVCDSGCDGLQLGAPELVLISALAAGADQIVAKAALEQEWRLESVLPFVRDEYAKDFSGADLAQFNALLSRSSSVLELDGKRTGEVAKKRAYEAAGLVMLSNSDIVIAIWDEQPAGGLGGTALIVASAIEDGIPVVLVDPDGKEEPKLIWTGLTDLPPGRPRIEELERRDALSSMTYVVESLILPPPPKDERDKLRAYLAEVERRWVPHFAYHVLQWVFAGRRPVPADFHHPEYVAETERYWKVYIARLPPLGQLGSAISGTLLRSHAFADRLAVAYAQRYRTAFTFNYLTASFAVTLALLGVFEAFQGIKPFLVLVELLLISTIAWRVFAATKLQWHRRWLEYRRLAEELRHLRILAPLASANRFRRPPSAANNRESWLRWLLMINARALPLPQAVVDVSYLSKLADALRKGELAEQMDYNSGTVRRMHDIEKGLHALGFYCFLATVGICVVFLILQVPALHPSEACTKTVEHWTTFLTALLPTLGAALSAIRVQGDFESFATRATRTLSRLERIDGAIDQLKPGATPPITLARLADHADKAAEAMSSDLDEWQILSTTKPVSLPA
jgi:hypothetical protein